MNGYLCSVLALVLVAILAGHAESRTIAKRAAAIEPHHDHEHEHDDLDAYRDKRKVEAKFDLKSALLGLVFNARQHAGFAKKSPTTTTTTTTTTKRPTTTEDIVIFEKNKPVSLQIPDQLFGSSFTLVTNLSNTVGDWMINSALRAQRLLESMRPLLRKVFGSKGFIIEATTDKPIFSENTV